MTTRPYVCGGHAHETFHRHLGASPDMSASQSKDERIWEVDMLEQRAAEKERALQQEVEVLRKQKDTQARL